MNNKLTTTAILSALLALGGLNVFAEEANTEAATESKVKVEDLKEKNKVQGDLDEEITNAKLRAETGSKSKYSLSMDLNYQGGNVTRAFGTKRPNLYKVSGNERVASLNNDLSARYRWTKNDSITAGIGVGFVTPLQGDLDKDSNQLKVNDPSLKYNRAFSAAGLQHSMAAGSSFGTSKVAQEEDKSFAPSLEYTMIKGFENGVSLGLAFSSEYIFYSTKPGQNEDVMDADYNGDARTEWWVGLYPFMEYAFNDRYSFRTVARYTTWYHRYGMDDRSALLHEVGTQSMGLGVAVTRDVYLYPNVQFLWQDLDAKKTNVALSATINVF